MYIYAQALGPLNPLVHGYNNFSPTALLPKAGYRLLIHEVSGPHAQIHHIRYKSSGRVTGPTQRTPPDNTHHSQERGIFAPAGSNPRSQ